MYFLNLTLITVIIFFGINRAVLADKISSETIKVCEGKITHLSFNITLHVIIDIQKYNNKYDRLVVKYLAAKKNYRKDTPNRIGIAIGKREANGETSLAQPYLKLWESFDWKPTKITDRNSFRNRKKPSLLISKKLSELGSSINGYFMFRLEYADNTNHWMKPHIPLFLHCKSGF